VVEFLGTKPISAEDAARGLASSVEVEAGAAPEVRYELPGSTIVNFRQIPGIIDALQTDWVGLQGEERPADCFIEVRGRLETHLHPCFLGEKLALGLRGAAGTLLLRFNRILQCVPLGFTRLLPAGKHGAVVGESPYVHFLADFRAVGFVPKEGQWLIGRPSEQQTMQGLNVLILNCFNMFIKAKHLPPELRWDDDKKCWVYGDKAHRLRAKRGPIWVQNSTSALNSRGPVPSIFGLLPWPPFAGEGGARPALSEHRRSGEASTLGAPAENEAAKEPSGKKDKKEKKEKKDKALASSVAEGAPATTGKVHEPTGVWTCPSCNARAQGPACRKCKTSRPAAQTPGQERRTKRSIDGLSANQTSGLHKDAPATGTKRRREGASSSSKGRP